MGGKQAQLADGAAPLALKSGGGQAGFAGADGGDLGAPRFDLIGDALLGRAVAADTATLATRTLSDLMSRCMIWNR